MRSRRRRRATSAARCARHDRRRARRRGTGRAQPQLLVVTETRGFVHDSIPAAKAMVASLGYRTTFLNGARELTARAPARRRRRRLPEHERRAAPRRGRPAPAAGLRARRRRLRRRARGRRHLPRLAGLPAACSAPSSSATRRRRRARRGSTSSIAPSPRRGSFAITDEFYAFRARAKRHVVVARIHDGGAARVVAALRPRARLLRRAGPLHRHVERPAPASAGRRRPALGYRDPSATLTTKPLPALTLTLCASPAGTTKLAAPSTS